MAELVVRSAPDLSSLFNERAGIYGTRHNEIEKLIGVYEGQLPTEFNDFFAEDMHVHLINMIRLDWDDLATMAGKEFPIYVEPDNNGAAARERAERQEKIGYGYNRAGELCGGIHMKLLMKVLMWWLVGTGNAVLMTLPSVEKKTPFFTFRDPRTHYPPVGWTPFNQSEAKDALFAYPMTIGEVKRRWPHARDEISIKVQAVTNGPDGKRVVLDDTTTIWVGEYYHAETWMVATLTDRVVTLARTDEGDRDHPGVQ